MYIPEHVLVNEYHLIFSHRILQEVFQLFYQLEQ